MIAKCVEALFLDCAIGISQAVMECNEIFKNGKLGKNSGD
jgi:hypothetical protein